MRLAYIVVANDFFKLISLFSNVEAPKNGASSILGTLYWINCIDFPKGNLVIYAQLVLFLDK